MKKNISIAILLILCFSVVSCSEKEPDIIVGSKDYVEQYIMGNMLSILIAENTNLNVSFKSDLATDVIFSSIRTGVIDLYMEYTGTMFSNNLKLNDVDNFDEIHEISVRELKQRHNLTMLEPLGFNNTFGLAVRKDTAAEFNLRTISDLASVSSDFIFAGSAEILTRADGIPNLKRLYDLSFKEERVLYGVDRYFAVKEDVIQVTEIFSTDGMLLEFDLVVLEDDKNFFPPYEGVVVIRSDTLEKHPELLYVLGRLEGQISDETMRNLNYRVDALDESPREVAESFLRERGLIG